MTSQTLSSTKTPTPGEAQTLAEGPALSVREVLGILALRRLWYAQVVSILGDFLAIFAVIEVMTFDLHAAPRLVTGVQVAYVLPIAVLGVVSGVFVDRWQLKPTLVISDLLRAGICLLLLLAHGTIGFYALLAAISVVSSFFGPAQSVAVQAIVPKAGLQPANMLLQLVFFSMRILGPFAAGVLVALLGARFCYVADAISFAVSALLISSIPLPAVKAADPSAQAQPGSDSALVRIGSDMRQGLVFIARHTALIFVVASLAAAMFVMGCFAPLIAVYVRDNLHTANRVFTTANILIGIGMLIGVSSLGGLIGRLARLAQVSCGLIGIATGAIVMAAIPSSAALYLGCLLIGLGCGGIVVPAQTLVQEVTPSTLLGRVGSTVMSVVYGAQIVGLLLSGVLVEWTGIRLLFAMGATLLFLLVVTERLLPGSAHHASTAPTPPAAGDYYGAEQLVERVRDALHAIGNRNGDGVIPWRSLAPYDQLHVGGPAATGELSAMLRLEPGHSVLDVGCGLGGPARHLAAVYQCSVTGLDLNETFLDMARLLTLRTGLSDRVKFVRGDAALLPFPTRSFDVVWTQHTVMRMADPGKVYAGFHNVLRPGGRFASYDAVAGEGGPALFPVPWARTAAESFLLTADEMREKLQSCGLEVLYWKDVTDQAIAWAEERTELLGESSELKRFAFPAGEFPAMAANLKRNLDQRRVRLVQSIVIRPA